MDNDIIRIVVPCYNSQLTIQKCVSAIFSSKLIDFELFIVDDGENGCLKALLKEYPVKLIKTAGRTGAGKARNAGTTDFKGSIVVFIDSDVQIDQDTITSLIRPIRNKDAEATVGCYKKVRSRNSFTDYKQFYLVNKYINKNYLFNTFWSAICAIDYKTFMKIGGFKECFFGAGPEDIDMGIELSGSGARILSVPEACGLHLSSYNIKTLFKNDFRKGSEDIYIHWKRRVPLRYNRHVSRDDIISTILLGIIPFSLFSVFYFGYLPFFINILFYAILRSKFIRTAFRGEDLRFIIIAFLLTAMSDLIKGMAVVNGTVLFVMNKVSSGSIQPFTKSNNIINSRF